VDDDGDQLGVVRHVDEVVGQAEQRRDGLEGQARGHEERGVAALARWQLEGGGNRPDTGHLGGELDQQHDTDRAGPVNQRSGRDESSRAQEKERGEQRERDRAQPSMSTRSCRNHPAITRPAT
jgi:hypothetical protein